MTLTTMIAELEEALKAATRGPWIVPHILDSDENTGERFRQALARAALKETTDV